MVSDKNRMDYIVFVGVIIGMFLILIAFFTEKVFAIVGGIVIAILFLAEILSLPFH